MVGHFKDWVFPDTRSEIACIQQRNTSVTSRPAADIIQRIASGTKFPQDEPKTRGAGGFAARSLREEEGRDAVPDLLWNQVGWGRNFGEEVALREQTAMLGKTRCTARPLFFIF